MDTHKVKTMAECVYGLTEVPSDKTIVTATGERDENGLLVYPPCADCLKWSGSMPIPAIGMRVRINFNELGSGVVHSYFYEHGFLGVRVTLDKKTRPAWHKKQNPQIDYAMVFGIEMEVVNG